MSFSKHLPFASIQHTSFASARAACLFASIRRRYRVYRGYLRVCVCVCVCVCVRSCVFVCVRERERERSTSKKHAFEQVNNRVHHTLYISGQRTHRERGLGRSALSNPKRKARKGKFKALNAKDKAINAKRKALNAKRKALHAKRSTQCTKQGSRNSIRSPVPTGNSAPSYVRRHTHCVCMHIVRYYQCMRAHALCLCRSLLLASQFVLRVRVHGHTLSIGAIRRMLMHAAMPSLLESIAHLS